MKTAVFSTLAILALVLTFTSSFAIDNDVLIPVNLYVTDCDGNILSGADVVVEHVNEDDETQSTNSYTVPGDGTIEFVVPSQCGDRVYITVDPVGEDPDSPHGFTYHCYLGTTEYAYGIGGESPCPGPPGPGSGMGGTVCCDVRWSQDSSYWHIKYTARD